MRLGSIALLALFPALSFAAEVNLTCELPTQNEDGSPLTDLAGIRFYESAVSGGPYTQVGYEPACALTLDRPAGTYYYVATAYNTSNIESVYSNEAMKVVTDPVPAPPTNLVATGNNLTAYTYSVTEDVFLTYPVGFVAQDTPCNADMTANGLYLVPKSAVTFEPGADANVVFAECSGG